MIEKQQTYKYKIYDQIKEDIITGVYSQGEVLNERRLSEIMGISRTPIREALQLLSRDGWVIYEVYKGAVVRTFEIDYVMNVQKVRKALEILAIEDAVLNINDDDVDKLSEVLDEQEHSLINYDPTEFMRLDRVFHEIIYGLSNNEVLLNLLKNINDIIRFFGIKVLMLPERNKATLSEHRAVVTALKERNLELAKNAMENHMLMTGNAILKYSSNNNTK